jgi:hypothetical protein
VKTLALALAATLLTGCVATTQQSVQPSSRSEPSGFAQFLRALAGPGPGLAAHDPSDPSMMFQQIPNWDNAALLRCCSAITDVNEWRQARCDTDQPVPPRTNRC